MAGFPGEFIELKQRLEQIERHLEAVSESVCIKLKKRQMI
jgi:hypothetical protein